GHERTRRRIVGIHGLLKRLLPDALKVRVERQLQRIAGLRRAAGQVAVEVPQRVDLESLLPVGSLQVVVVVPLEPRLAAVIGLRNALVAKLVELRAGCWL